MTETIVVDQIKRLEKRLEREKNARQQAEDLLEEKSRQLYELNSNLSEHMRLVEASVLNAKDGVMVTTANLDEGPHIVFVNEALCKLSGYTEEELIGKTPRILQGADTSRDVLNDLKYRLQNGKSFQGELQNYTKDGTSYWLDVSITPVKNDDGEVTHFTAIERDITDRKIIEQEMSEQRDKAEQANIAKSDFLANMSHELRTPMNGIIGLSDLLMDTKLDDEQKQSVEAINNSSEGLLLLLNDILDFSKIEADEMTLENIPFDLKRAVDETINLLKPQVEKKGLQLDTYFAPTVPRGIMGDSSRIRQILTNLIGNAVKFTDKGSITVNFTRSQNNMIKVTVDDTGIGIPPSRLDDIFKKFTQADESTTRQYGGTGLGLAICQKLVNLMNGNIGVDSVIGQGSSFWFTIPLIEADIEIKDEKSNTTSDAVDFGNAHILVVDDHPVNLMFARKLLKKIGIERIQLADNGQEAFEYTQVAMYDAILMDCQMPGMDGFQTTEAIRKMHRGNALHTPIIAVTANAMKGDREKCLEAGMDDYLSKPIDPNSLIQTLQKWIQTTPKEEITQDDFIASVDDFAVAEETPEPPEISGNPPVDLPALRDLFGDDPEDEKMLFDLFFSTADEALNNLQQAITENDNEKWRKAAHKIKGSAANMRAENLAAICTQAESDSDATQDQKDVLLKDIQDNITRVREYLNAESA